MGKRERHPGDGGIPFIILTGERCGGTLLSHLLDSHPRVMCHKGEILSNKHWLSRYTNNAIEKLTCAFNMPGYLACGVKILFGDVPNESYLKKHILKERYPIIVLVRNPLRSYVSLIISRTREELGNSAHTYRTLNEVHVTLDIPSTIEYMMYYLAEYKWWVNYFMQNKYTTTVLEYIDIAQNLQPYYGEYSDEIPEYHYMESLVINGLSCIDGKLISYTQIANPKRMEYLVRNYEELEKAMVDVGYSHWLNDTESVIPHIAT